MVVVALVSITHTRGSLIIIVTGLAILIIGTVFAALMWNAQGTPSFDKNGLPRSAVVLIAASGALTLLGILHWTIMCFK